MYVYLSFRKWSPACLYNLMQTRERVRRIESLYERAP